MFNEYSYKIVEIISKLSLSKLSLITIILILIIIVISLIKTQNQKKDEKNMNIGDNSSGNIQVGKNITLKR